ncbi:carboxymethylenebutenolidase homolog isoform X1 [Sesamum indicum]|uniref:Carboxymethylenebutenolidase homolog n=2 Tax=Sesamum indicum TaxID=4182 RepID=A0A6I9SWE6_SESIN|nr:carboxymethylenebutenolidase homolog isoform X1 [Sesamum indicum]
MRVFWCTFYFWFASSLLVLFSVAPPKMGWSSSAPVFSAPPIYKPQHKHKHLPPAPPPMLQFPKSNLDRWNMQRQWSSAVCKSNKLRVRCREVKVEESTSVHDDEACELVNGTELTIGDNADGIRAYLFTAVKNNNATGILLLSDIFGFEDSATRDFAYRVACTGYNVLVPDLFNGDPWTKDRPNSLLQQWITKHQPERIAKTIFASANWMVNELAAVGISRKVGIIGFCYGGGRVIDILAQDQGDYFGCGVSFYGTRIDSSVASHIKVPLLLITGDDDGLCPVSVLEDITKRNKQSKMVVFQGRGHSFAHRPQTPEEDKDAEEAFTMMRNWLYNNLLAKT